MKDDDLLGFYDLWGFRLHLIQNIVENFDMSDVEEFLNYLLH